jgi:hypothetical protein
VHWCNVCVQQRCAWDNTMLKDSDEGACSAVNAVHIVRCVVDDLRSVCPLNDKVPGIFRDVIPVSYGIPSGTSSNLLLIPQSV